ncbi:MAG: hypothetical protein FGM56_07660, partial [Limnohabitans sp.]|nr:hypothetical protein [Limnohabitans sp.]
MKKLFALSVLAATALTGANAADFPIKDKPVTIVVPFTAGGPTDRVARDLAEALRKPLGANVVVENVAGAGGTIGANKVAKAPQDGHTVLLHQLKGQLGAESAIPSHDGATKVQRGQQGV